MIHETISGRAVKIELGLLCRLVLLSCICLCLLHEQDMHYALT
jgi:hypothetical protein